MGTLRLGPEHGSIQVRTYREGVAQRVGHDLVLEATRWSATVETGPDGALTAVGLEVDASELHVREGHNGVKPLTDKDRREIRRRIDTEILHGRPISFRSASVDGASIAGELTVDGTTRPASFEVDLSGGRVRGTLPLVQTDFGIKPYKGLMGALRVRDTVEIVLDVELPA